MFDVGFAELFLLSVIGLLVLGPERLPAVARTLGGLIRKARVSWNSLKRTIESEMAVADVKDPIRAAQEHLEAMQRKLNEPVAPAAGAKQDQPAESAEAVEAADQAPPPAKDA